MDIKNMIQQIVENYFTQESVILKLKKFLMTEYQYNCAAKAQKVKPESVFQEDLIAFIKGLHFKVEAPFTIETSKEGIEHTLKEKQFQYDLEIYANGHRCCLVELKYDEVKDDGKSTNPHGEDQIRRDLYRLEKWKEKHPSEGCFAIFATNKEDHWKNFIKINKGNYEVDYDGQIEKFKLLNSYSIKWTKGANSQYQFCVIEVKKSDNVSS